MDRGSWCQLIIEPPANNKGETETFIFTVQFQTIINSFNNCTLMSLNEETKSNNET